MGRKKVGKNRLDKFYYLAKDKGYRARSAFKLAQLNQKYQFLGTCQTLLDLCAAPGGWMQIAEKEMPVSKKILGVDLNPIKPIPNCKSIIGDITTESCIRDIKHFFSGEKIDVVLNDGAPNVGASWEKDSFEQNDLVLKALRIATLFLKPGGIFLTKVFRSKDYISLMWVFNQFFEKVESTKPMSSRNESAEVFVFCKGYRRLDKIDQSFFDPDKVFTTEDVEEFSYKKFKFKEFLFTSKPLDMIRKCSSILFEENEYENIFDKDLKERMLDCQNISENEIKKILSKRLKILKTIGREVKVEEKIEEKQTDDAKLKKIEAILKKKKKDEEKEERYKLLRIARSKSINVDESSSSEEENKQEDISEHENSEESDSESFEINEQDKRCLVAYKEDPEGFKDASINKYAHNEQENLPEFYLEEEKELNKNIDNLFAEDGEKFKKLKKKEIEVNSRKMRRALKFNQDLLEENEDGEKVLPDRILRLGFKRQKKKKRTVVIRKGKNIGRIKKNTVLVDKRMKKDKKKR